MVRNVVIPTLICLFVSCKKKEDRTCFKSYGEPAEREVLLDSVVEFRLFDDLTYHIYQDTMKKIIIRGGKNVIGHVNVSDENHVVSISNANKCNFLRDYDKKTEVEIHYPSCSMFYSESNDSLIFHDTIRGYKLHVEQVMGAAGIRVHAEVTTLVLIASHGVGSYYLSGFANEADLRVETNASGNAENFIAGRTLIYQNSTGDIRVNLDGSDAGVTIKGTGHVMYTGNPDSLKVVQVGDGDLIHY